MVEPCSLCTRDLMEIVCFHKHSQPFDTQFPFYRGNPTTWAPEELSPVERLSHTFSGTARTLGLWGQRSGLASWSWSWRARAGAAPRAWREGQTDRERAPRPSRVRGGQDSRARSRGRRAGRAYLPGNSWRTTRAPSWTCSPPVSSRSPTFFRARAVGSPRAPGPPGPARPPSPPPHAPAPAHGRGRLRGAGPRLLTKGPSGARQARPAPPLPSPPLPAPPP
jgi:hypothetical protein